MSDYIDQKYPTKLDKSSMTADEWRKARTLELYSYLPQTSFEDRATYTDIRDELVELNYNFFRYIALHIKSIYNQTVTTEDKLQSALMHFCEIWYKYKFEGEVNSHGKRYRDDIAFSSFFKPRIAECMEREFNNVKYSTRRTLCIRAGEQLGKKWTEVKYEDLNLLKGWSTEDLHAIQAVFCSTNNQDFETTSIFRPSTRVEADNIDQLYFDEYDSLEDLIVHEMIENECKLDDKYLLEMSEMYTIPYADLVKARPIGEAKLKKQLEDAMFINDAFETCAHYASDSNKSEDDD